MTRIQAIEIVEEAVLELKIIGDDDEPLGSIESLSVLDEALNGALDQIEEEFFLLNGSPDRYVEEMLSAISAFQSTSNHRLSA